MLSEIYQGTITTWNNPAITTLNPGVTLPSIPIVTLHRSDSSGDTFLFTQFLSKTDPSGWGTKIAYDTTVPWPNAPGALGEMGNSGMVIGLQGHTGLHRLRRHQLPDPGPAGRARLRPAAERQGHLRAAHHGLASPPRRPRFVKKTPANGTISLIYGPATNGYPIVNYEYAIVNTKQTSTSTAKAIRSVLEWAINKNDGNSAHYLARWTSSRCRPRSSPSRSSRSSAIS